MGLFDWFTLNKPDPPQAVVLPPLRRHILDFIEAWEGRKLVPYVDDAGYPTVGVGHKILSHEAFGECISEQECNVLLAKDFNDKRFAVAVFAQRDGQVLLVLLDVVRFIHWRRAADAAGQALDQLQVLALARGGLVVHGTMSGSVAMNAALSPRSP